MTKQFSKFSDLVNFQPSKFSGLLVKYWDHNLKSGGLVFWISDLIWLISNHGKYSLQLPSDPGE